MQENVPQLYSYMMSLDVACTMMLNQTLPQRFIMTIFTVVAPIKISKYFMDLFIIEKTNETCLFRVLFRCLKYVEPRCLEMEEDDLFYYFKNGIFL
jgi:hypothetical protein